MWDARGMAPYSILHNRRDGVDVEDGSVGFCRGGTPYTLQPFSLNYTIHE